MSSIQYPIGWVCLDHVLNCGCSVKTSIGWQRSIIIMSLDRNKDASIVEFQNDAIVNYEEISGVIDIELEMHYLH